MDELHGGADEPGHEDRPDPYVPRAGGDADALRLRVEPRSRAEYAADLEQRVAEVSFRAAGGEVLRRFEPGRAGLPETGRRDAATYLEAHRAERPWLAAAAGCPPEVQRVFAALDRGGGHAHIRHEGWVTEEMNRRRVAYLEDPAQLDPAKRAAGIDGLASQERSHRCRDSSSRITDPEAFAVAFARGIEHPLVRAALDTGFTAGRVPRPVTLDVSSLLGPDGQRYCTGWRLQPVDGSMDLARERRAAWLETRSRDGHADTPEPNVRPAWTFDGGVVVFAFGPNRARDGYEVVTMYPRPPKDDQQGDSR